VTKALRDYVWSVGINGGTGPAGPPSDVAPAAPPAERSATTARATRPPSGRTSAAP
jgi:hypothetical protein